MMESHSSTHSDPGCCYSENVAALQGSESSSPLGCSPEQSGAQAQHCCRLRHVAGNFLRSWARDTSLLPGLFPGILTMEQHDALVIGSAAPFIYFTF